VDRSTLEADLRSNAFASGRRDPMSDRIGAEVEFLALLAGSGRPAPLLSGDGPALLPAIRRHAALHGWTEEPTPYGAPRFTVPGGGSVFFEPGGQVEFSSAPASSPGTLLRNIREVVPDLVRALAGEGIDAVWAGIDPLNPLESAPLVLDGGRYGRMAAHFARFGPAGGRMMRQTAAFQLNLDFGADAWSRWRVLNAAAPYLLALFASSARYEGRDSCHRSFRAACWRALDPTRTGLLAIEDDPVREYFHFAMDALAILKGVDDQPPIAFRNLARGRSLALGDWHAHLTTLFPEVRPKGFLELRTLDAVGPDGWAAAVLVVAGLVRPLRIRDVLDLLGTPDPALLLRAGEVGLADPRIRSIASDLCELALAGTTPEDDATERELSDARTWLAGRLDFDEFVRGGCPQPDHSTSVSQGSR
jgi:glutamate--cysteine ligase